MVNVVTKLMPTVAKSLGVKGAVELALVASLGAEGLNVIGNKGKAMAQKALGDKIEVKKQQLYKKRAETLEQKAKNAAAMVQTEEVPEEEVKVEEKPNNTSKKKNK